ncbi:UDP-N-acetylglucosamine 2-epimerase (non-hydrolyzing) [Rhodobacteraceae bacterium IMCC1335]
MRKILFVFGTRPEAIKMAPVILHMKNDPSLDVRVCVTGQHREMLDQVLNLFQIDPDHDLNLMKIGQNLSELSASILSSIDAVLTVEKPDLVLVHGDTTTSVIAALSCYYRKIPIGHIEAGLRSGDLNSPWPEEGNRRLTAQIARFHFAPTPLNAQNLISEGIAPSNVYITGNTVIDALLKVRSIISSPDYEPNDVLEQELDFISSFDRMILITGHRRENFGDNFNQICLAIKDLAKKYSQTLFLYPVHLNPHVQEPANRILSGLDNVRLTKPLDYEGFVALMDRAFVILTDSGGIQEEAPALGKPVLVMRENTERPEGITSGTSILVGYSRVNIVEEVSRLLDNKNFYETLSKQMNPYGTGDASVKIAEIIKSEL